MLNKTNRLSLAEQASMQIEQLIESGVWQVGMKIPTEPELMEELQVSRNTLREAMRALTHAGLLKTRQGDGTYVSSSSALGPVLKKRIQRSDILQTLEVRHALEREAAILAATRRTEQDLEEIQQHIESCKLAVHSRDHAAYALADIAFHRSIIAASHNPLLMELYNHMTEGVRETISDVMELSSHSYYLQNHEMLLLAIQQNDSSQAAETVRIYIEHSKEHFQQQRG
ncbi:FadR family transcriptional regulator [Paenibacillus sp. CGMCC 1.16610]|uniref:FCD domain-containing protein n=1 Tax=Paenibacillus anseongense TaxID=2682845 RepID=A0ABW9U900_9BACL|nr:MULTISPECIES: FadR/GntR family transcriptional regulator [Paenibacillus]MBA2937410.1 FadR family transcriptional regulator [Paenibacillus sp. CGMCC 1.16610]MVQ36468.1 FCD domain-containing protein [Paenibacillus anseongense]